MDELGLDEAGFDEREPDAVLVGRAEEPPEVKAEEGFVRALPPGFRAEDIFAGFMVLLDY